MLVSKKYYASKQKYWVIIKINKALLQNICNWIIESNNNLNNGIYLKIKAIIQKNLLLLLSKNYIYHEFKESKRKIRGY